MGFDLQVYLQRVPQLVGRTFGELAFYLPMATVYGIMQFSSRRCCLLPPPDTVIQVCHQHAAQFANGACMMR